MADFNVLLARNPTDSNVLFSMAHTKLARGDTEGYQALCRQELDKVTESTDPRDLNNAVWYNLLIPCSAADAARLVELSERAVAGAKTDHDRRTLINTHAAALFRAARYGDARQWLQKSIERKGSGGVVEDWLLLALTEHHLKNPVQARQWLEKADLILAAPPEKYSDGERIPSSWDVRVSWEVLAREARLLIGPSPTPDLEQPPSPVSPGSPRQ